MSSGEATSSDSSSDAESSCGLDVVASDGASIHGQQPAGNGRRSNEQPGLPSGAPLLGRVGGAAGCQQQPSHRSINCLASCGLWDHQCIDAWQLGPGTGSTLAALLWIGRCQVQDVLVSRECIGWPLPPNVCQAPCEIAAVLHFGWRTVVASILSRLLLEVSRGSLAIVAVLTSVAYDETPLPMRS